MVEEPEDGAPHSDAAESFDEELEAGIAVAYPILVDRVQKANFAGWHRRRRLEFDLVQEAATQVLSHCRRHRVMPDDVTGYLVATARNLAKKQYRLSREDPAQVASEYSLGHAAELLVWMEEQIDSENPSPEAKAQLEAIRLAIEQLPKRQRLALELRLREPGATHKELADKMGVNEDAFQKNLARAHSRIRQLIEKSTLNIAAEK